MLSPRYHFGSLDERGLVCSSGYHSCLEINSTACCPNNSFCYLKPSWDTACCLVGSDCDNPCAVSQYLCNATSIITTTVTQRSTTSVSTSKSVFVGCCPRACSASGVYQCASQYGGQCCPFGFSCATSSCVSTATLTGAVVTETPAACDANQLSCASGTASAPVSPSSNTPIPDTSDSSGLSPGKKAGVAVFASLMGCAIIGVLVWWFWSRRRRRQKNSTDSLSLSPRTPPDANEGRRRQETFRLPSASRQADGDNGTSTLGSALSPASRSFQWQPYAFEPMTPVEMGGGEVELPADTKASSPKDDKSQCSEHTVELPSEGGLREL